MKKLDDYELELCKFQGKLFELSAKLYNSSSSMFIKRFCNSKLSQRLDKNIFLCESTSFNELFEELNDEYNDIDYGKEIYSSEELYWIGYLFKYWNISSKVKTKTIYKIVNAQEIRKLYYPYHSLSMNAVIERITEAKQIPDRMSIEFGVETMKKAVDSNSIKSTI